MWKELLVYLVLIAIGVVLFNIHPFIGIAYALLMFV